MTDLPLVFISYAHVNQEHAARLASRLDASGRFKAWWDQKGNAPGADWPRNLRAAIAKADVFLFMVTSGKEETHWQMEELLLAQRHQEESAERRLLIIPVVVGGARPNFGLGSYQCLELDASDDPDAWNDVPEKLMRAMEESSRVERAVETTELHWARYLEVHAMAEVSQTLPEWLATACGHPRLRPLVQHMLDRVKSILHRNTPDEYNVHLRHVAVLLGWLRQLCGVRQSERPRDGRDFVIEDPEECFLASFAILVHNLCLNRRLAGPALPDERSIFDRTRDYMCRTETVRQQMVDGLKDPGQVVLVNQVFRIAVEMYRDYVFREPTEETVGKQLIGSARALFNEHEAWRKSEVGQRTRDLTRCLRMCDALDVQHRLLPDVISLFFHFTQYEDGVRCFFDHVFPGIRAFPLVQSVSVSGGILHIGFLSPQTPDISHSPVRGSLRIVAEFLAHRFEQIHRQVWEGQTIYPNLDIGARAEARLPDEPITPDQLGDLEWMLFPLVMVAEPSDTIALQRAAELLPSLIAHVVRTNALHPQRDDQVRKQVTSLARQFVQLRPYSEEMNRLVAAVERELGPDAMSYAATAESAVLGLRAQNRWIAGGFEVPIDRVARQEPGRLRVLIFGASKPAAVWVGALASANPDMEIVIQPVHCVRRLVLRDPTPAAGLQSLIPGNDHETAIELVADELKKRGIDIGTRVKLDKTPVDIFGIPRVHSVLQAGEKLEVVLGTRGFVVVDERYHAVCIYGADVLAMVSRVLGIHTRLVTWEDRFQHPASQPSKPDLFVGRRFCMSYSACDLPNTESEFVQIDRFGIVVTELADYPTEQVEPRLKERFKALQPAPIDQTRRRYTELVDRKFTRSLSPTEESEMGLLRASLDKAEALPGAAARPAPQAEEDRPRSAPREAHQE